MDRGRSLVMWPRSLSWSQDTALGMRGCMGRQDQASQLILSCLPFSSFQPITTVGTQTLALQLKGCENEA